MARESRFQINQTIWLTTWLHETEETKCLACNGDSKKIINSIQYVCKQCRGAGVSWIANDEYTVIKSKISSIYLHEGKVMYSRLNGEYNENERKEHPFFATREEAEDWRDLQNAKLKKKPKTPIKIKTNRLNRQ